MLNTLRAFPAKEKETNECRFQEEGHETFDSQRRAEYVTDVMGVDAQLVPN